MKKRQGRKECRYRVDLLETVQAFQRRARRDKKLEKGQLVYYGPMPKYYGIGEVRHVVGPHVAVDFRGTGTFGVHEEIFDQRYLVRIPQSTLSQL